jgi:hypothetical protein
MKMPDINSVLRKNQDHLMSIPNVAGVGIGEKEGKTVIVVFVKRKIPESGLQPHEIVPRSLEGYATDVREIGDVKAQP